jgi:hypothetical protein
LDTFAIDVDGVAPPARRLSGGPPRWRPLSVAPSEYVLSSDHARPDNAVLNPNFAKGNPDAAEGWSLSGAARVNRPFRKALDRVSLAQEKTLGVVELDPAAPARPFDVVEVSGSAKGNDGPYRLIMGLGSGRWGSKKRVKAAESGLRGILFHDDGCGLVPGGCGVEISGDGAASQRAGLPPGARAVRLSFFYRVYDPKALGTRDVPGRCVQVKTAFLDPGGRPVGGPWVIADLACSYQWQKEEAEHPVPAGAVTLELTAQSASAAVVQYTGFYLGPMSK